MLIVFEILGNIDYRFEKHITMSSFEAKSIEAAIEKKGKIPDMFMVLDINAWMQGLLFVQFDLHPFDPF